MELTAESLQQVKFGAKVRGYDPEEVDRFIANVTEIGEELHERLRRATERAQKAEEQLANAPVASAEITPANQSAELGRIWERAVAAAEGAVEEAKAEAKSILDEANRAAADTVNNANRSAEETTSNANRSADETITNAQREAARIAEESQGQIRGDIARLESARDQLSHDVDGLSAFLSEEKSRLRAAIVKALSEIDDYGAVGDSAPSLSQVDVPPAPAPAPVAPPSYEAPQSFDAPPSFEAPHSFEAPEPAPAPEYQSYSEPEPEPEQHRFEEAPTFAHEEPEQPAWASDEPIETPPAPAQVPWQEPEPVQAQQEEDDSDPFLAELRRAVRDDGPLGPRDDDNEEDSIDRLYADDNDDKSFFKRKK